LTESASPLAGWRVWVDTGGTFTDAIGVDPGGAMHRAKVLSTSALRGVALECEGSALRIRESWRGPDDLVIGFGFRWLAAPPAPDLPRVVGYERSTGMLRLAAAPAAAPPLTAFELLSPDEAPVLAARMLTGTGAGASLPPLEMRLATTRGTNALLERRGAPVALFLTRGFADLLTIGSQQRSDLFALRFERPPPLYWRVYEVEERLSASGAVLTTLAEASVWTAAREAVEAGVRTAAVSLLHAYLDDRHEERVGELLREAGFAHVTLSSRVAPVLDYLRRTTTAVTDAYLTPVLDRYLARVVSAVGADSGSRGSLRVMTSAGGLTAPAEFSPKDSLLSGPAAGVVGAAEAGKLAGFERIIAFDMGGTSTDVARFDGHYDYVWRHSVGDVELHAPALAIRTVAAGGGSICAMRAGALAVGPESAAADPGPACYGAGGPLTLTDCNLLAGRLDTEGFGIPLSVSAAEDALERLRDELEAATGVRPERDSLLEGLIEIADERMAEAIRQVSVRRGYDPADYALVVFGGAGAQHGCGIAEKLGIRTVVVPPDLSLLSAWGLGRAVIERVAARQVLTTLGEDDRWVRIALEELGGQATAAVAAEGIPVSQVRVTRRIASLRFTGQEATVEVELPRDRPLGEAFLARYAATFGHLPEGREIEVESLRAIAASLPDPLPDASPPERPATSREAPTTLTRIGGEWREIPVRRREDVPSEEGLVGPCLVRDPHSMLLVPGGWEVRSVESGALVVRRSERAGDPVSRRAAAGATPEAVVEQLFTSRFEAIVGEMGEQLRRTALSVNVKERLDFSCALLDPAGELVANAPHIPVHLGALGLCVRSVALEVEMGPGDVVVTNHPAFGGSHLPDVTVITPVFDEAGTLLGYVANRAHHAEIGGAAPGSMPPRATRLMEEGVVIPPMKLVEAGRGRWSEIERLLAAGRYPSRAIPENLADLRAQVAANQRGADLLRALARQHGADLLQSQMSALADRAEKGVRTALHRFAGVHRAVQQLDDGSPIAVEIAIGDGSVRFDFHGTGPVQPGNLNATPAIVRSAVLYVLRLLISEPLPLNEGLLRRVLIVLPEPSLLAPDFGGDPARAPAVGGGNTEVSQRLVDTLIRALGIAACSQGTMNNVLWGNRRFGYYETIGGGQGATAGGPGASVVHTHMTNTRITDVEVVEHRYPVRVERFAVRSGSGGAGAHPGGDGAVREVTFLEPMTLSVLTQHRRTRPFGAAGGEPGAAGRQYVVRATGDVVELDPVDGCDVDAGDRLVIETPGGGGWGRV